MRSCVWVPNDSRQRKRMIFKLAFFAGSTTNVEWTIFSLIFFICCCCCWMELGTMYLLQYENRNRIPFWEYFLIFWLKSIIYHIRYWLLTLVCSILYVWLYVSNITKILSNKHFFPVNLKSLIELSNNLAPNS